MNGFCLTFRLYYVRVYKGRFDMQNKLQAALIFATKLKITKRATQSSTNFVELVNKGHGKHRLLARRATGLTVAEREESFTRTESVAKLSREGRAAYEAEREPLLLDFFIYLF